MSSLANWLKKLISVFKWSSSNLFINKTAQHDDTRSCRNSTVVVSWYCMQKGNKVCRIPCCSDSCITAAELLSDLLLVSTIKWKCSWMVGRKGLGRKRFWKMAASWDIAPCSLLEVDRFFRGAYCLNHQGDNGCSKHLWNIGKLIWTVHTNHNNLTYRPRTTFKYRRTPFLTNHNLWSDFISDYLQFKLLSHSST
jgi:hypothetical protein